jgi:hypothetical protein
VGKFYGDFEVGKILSMVNFVVGILSMVNFVVFLWVVEILWDF